MRFAPLARRALLLVAIALAVAGCATPQEAGPTDLHRDRDNDGIPDDEARDVGNASNNGTPSPGGTPTGMPNSADPYSPLP